MTGPWINNGRHVYLDQTISGDGAVLMDAAMAVPPPFGLEINGAPVREQFHEYVVRKADPDGKDQAG